MKIVIRRLILRIEVRYGDHAHVRRRADRGDYTPPGFVAIEPAVSAGDSVELRIEVQDEDEARHWSISPGGQLRRDVPPPPPAPSVVR